MSVSERKTALAALAAARKRPIITYVTSRREGLPTVVAPDVFPVIYEHLKKLSENSPEIDFFVMTLGGDTTVPLPLLHLIREYADKVNVLVPAECLSSGTMIALGADNIVMSPLGQLSPIDPSVGHPLNPQAPIVQQTPNGSVTQTVQIGVEQVFSYLALATDKAKLEGEESRSKAFDRLVQAVHPIALGEIHRTHSLIRLLAEKLLKMHMTDPGKVEKIVVSLTEKLFSHGYRISRREATLETELPVVKPDKEVEDAMMGLRDLYVRDAAMDSPFNILADIRALSTGAGQAPIMFPLNFSYECAFIGSSFGETVFRVAKTVEQNIAQNSTQPFFINDSYKWEASWY